MCVHDVKHIAYMKVVLYQWSILSPLLFAVDMDVVSSEEISGLPSNLLYADNLVTMALIMEHIVDVCLNG